MDCKRVKQHMSDRHPHPQSTLPLDAWDLHLGAKRSRDCVGSFVCEFRGSAVFLPPTRYTPLASNGMLLILVKANERMALRPPMTQLEACPSLWNALHWGTPWECVSGAAIF